MWSLGCIIYELLTGRPLFPAKDENELIEYFIVTIGSIPENIYINSKKYKQFFQKSISFLGYTSHNLIRCKESCFDINKSLKSGSQSLRYLLAGKNIEEDIVDFMEKCLVFEKDLRLAPEDALNHQWFFIKKEHVEEQPS